MLRRFVEITTFYSNDLDINSSYTCCNEFVLLLSDNEALGITPNPLKRSSVTQYPRVSNAFKILHPHFDNYEDHIIKSNRIYIDRTTKGHWTIGACKLNRFYHRFGFCDELVDDVNSIKLEEKFHDAHASPDAVSNVMSDIEQSV